MIASVTSYGSSLKESVIEQLSWTQTFSRSTSTIVYIFVFGSSVLSQGFYRF